MTGKNYKLCMYNTVYILTVKIPVFEYEGKCMYT